MPPPQRAPPALMEELVEEILLRFPPDDPARLFRAAVVCKAWCRLISGSAFRRRFRKIHGTPPLLGLICRSASTYSNSDFRVAKTHFMANSTFRLPKTIISRWRAIDALHGRILFWDLDTVCSKSEFVAWSPNTSEVRRLPTIPCLRMCIWSAALLCATAGCDHLDCGHGATSVVLVGINLIEGLMSVYVYSSEKHIWSEPISIQDRTVRGFRGPSAIVGKTVYFLCVRDGSSKLLAYEVCKQELSFVSLPSVRHLDDYFFIALTTADEGNLGFVTMGNRLYAVCFAVCRVPFVGHSANNVFAECRHQNSRPNDGTRQTRLCRVRGALALGKPGICRVLHRGTRQTP
ncbi:hypothetical protein EJB05_13846, partial [Eragrostis curvula]